MNFGNKLTLSRKERKPGGVKGERQFQSVTHNPSTHQSGNTLLVKLPKLAKNTLMVPGTVKLVFNLNITGDTDSWFVNDLASNLINRMEIKWGTKSLLNINNVDVLNNYARRWLTTQQRSNLVRQGLQTTNLSKLRSNATSAVTTDASENRLDRILTNKYEIPLDFTFLTDQHPFYPYIYMEDIEISLYFQRPGLVINSTVTTVITDYNLSNITLEYETIYSPEIADEIERMSTGAFGITYFYDYISFIGRNPIDQADLSFTLTVQDPRKSIRGVLMLFTLTPPTAARVTETYFNPEITNVDITIDGITNKIFAQGYREDRMFTEAQKYFLGEERKKDDNSIITFTNFYGTPTSSNYALWIDTRSTEDNTLHGSGLMLRNGSNMLIRCTKNNTGTGPINVFTYLVSDAQFTLINKFATDPQY